MDFVEDSRGDYFRRRTGDGGIGRDGDHFGGADGGDGQHHTDGPSAADADLDSGDAGEPDGSGWSGAAVYGDGDLFRQQKTWQHNAPSEETREPAGSFDAWASQSFATWTGALSGREVTMQILLPIAAVALGMTIFGLVFYFDVPHVG